MFGIGKKNKTKFGRFLDEYGIKQSWLIEKSGVSRATVNRLVNEKDYAPNVKTVSKIMTLLNKKGFLVNVKDFW